MVQPREDRLAAGLGIMTLAVALFICVDTSAKWLILAGLAPVQAVFARYAGHLFFALLAFLPREGRAALSTAHPRLQILRALSLLGSTTLNFLALSHLPITVTTTIAFSIPLIVTVMAVPILGERVGIRRILAVLAGFGGVLVVTQPWGAEWHPAMFYSLGAVISAALYFILTRMLAGKEDNSTLQIWSSAVPSLILLPFSIANGIYPETLLAWVVFAAIGFFGFVSHYLATTAHRLADASLLSPLMYTQILFAAIAGVLVFDTWPTIYTLGGGGIIIASGLYIWAIERQRRREG